MKRESKKRRRRFSTQKNSKENLNATVHCFVALNLFSPQAPRKTKIKKPKKKVKKQAELKFRAVDIYYNETRN